MSTKIEWATETWNPIRTADGGYHCTKVSEGCQHCYAERMNKRFGNGKPFDDTPTEFVLNQKQLEKPLHWKKPRRIFVQSMGDLFHEDVPFCFIEEIFCAMEEADWHVFMVLTKRPERMFSFIDWYLRRSSDDSVGFQHKLPEHIWLGVTAENQQAADERIPILLQTPAATVRFVSVEPMLGTVDLTQIDIGGNVWINSLTGDCKSYHPYGGMWKITESKNKLDWVICGGETGPGARPMHPDWVRDLRDQCVRTGVPFFFKQWGEFAPSPDPEMGSEYWVTPDGNFGRWDYSDPSMPVAACMDKVGKKAAGYLIDGQEWRQFPNPYHWEEAET
jgi:protein gp37